MTETTGPLAGRIAMWFFVPVTSVLGLWLLAGPGLYGESAWITVFGFFVFVPLLLVWMCTVMLIVLLSPRRPRGFSTGQLVLIAMVWLSMAVYGATVLDYVDTKENGRSVAMHFLGSEVRELSVGLAWLGLLAGSVVAVVVVIVQIVDLVRSKK